MKRRCITGEEHDVHSWVRRLLLTFDRPGVSSAAKRRTRRRERRESKSETEDSYLDYLEEL